jgi:hypothetical protein
VLRRRNQESLYYDGILWGQEGGVREQGRKN